jgi:hypothetical protein
LNNKHAQYSARASELAAGLFGEELISARLQLLGSNWNATRPDLLEWIIMLLQKRRAQQQYLPQ